MRSGLHYTGMAGLGVPTAASTASAIDTFYKVAAPISIAFSAFHGYRRNVKKSPFLGAVIWGIFGGVFPLITPVIAVASGYGKDKTLK